MPVSAALACLNVSQCIVFINKLNLFSVSKLSPVYGTVRSLFFHLFCLRSVLAILHETFCQYNWLRTIIKQYNYENYNHTQSNQSTAFLKDCSKVEVHELVRLLKFICCILDFLDHLDQQIIDLLFYIKAQTFSI